MIYVLCLQAVTFLKRIKEVVEDPRRLLLDV
jgi:pyruvate/2-oxoglutarate dehydrogenase complex dihydrolipoamide acyltransferase (E2) component